MVKRDDEIYFDEFGCGSLEVQEQFQKNINAFEQAEWCNPFQVLIDSGISLPSPNELPESELNAKLWEVINAISLMGMYLEHSDHLSDRELYTLLLNDILLENTIIQSPDVTLNCHIDLIGSGSEEDNNIYLKFYADEHDRNLWITDFPDEPMLGRELLPFDRDRQLPKPDREAKLSRH